MSNKTSSPQEIEQLGFDLERLDRVRARVLTDIEAERCHGVNMIVARRGKVVLDITEGFASKAEQKALSRDSVFATMSVAKQFTNVLALSLVERGLLTLHAPLAELIPEFATLGKEKVNLFHLLTHTSGVMSAIPPVPPEILTNIDSVLEWACALPLESQPGERVNYSILLGHSIIAALCLRADGRGRSYAQMLKDEIFEPLGMTDTSLGVRDDLQDRFCPVKVSYKDVPALLPPEAVEGLGAVLMMPGAELPGGGCVTTIGDLHRFAEMLRRGGELDGTRIISPAMLDFCTRTHTGNMRNILFDMWWGTRNWIEYPASLGCGFFMRGEGNLPGLFSVMNSPRTFGGFGAGSTGFTVDPERDLTFSFLSTGLMEDSYHFERVGVLASLVLSAITDLD
ncbi:MAG: serine hydrolase domain-containing protein [Gammaproteobacteria bacterium]